MFEFIHKHNRIVQGILALTALPFALWGVYSYDKSRDSGNDVASVGADKISYREFDEALSQQRDRMRRSLGANFDPATLDNPEMRYSILQSIINEHLLRRQAQAENIRISEDQLIKFIHEVPAFQENGVFSPQRYEAAVNSQKLSEPEFERRLRLDLQLQPLQEAYLSSGIVARSSSERFVQLIEQKREVSVATVDVAPYLAQVKVDDAAIKSFYDANPSAFQVPEQVKIEYVVLSRDALVASQAVSEDEIKKFYEANFAPKYAEKAKARKKAEELLAELKKHPDKFADLARENSQDPGSAKNGGDLDYFPRGAMVKPFEDTAFKLKLNQISDIVESDFGYHIIKLTGIKPADKASGKAEERRASHILINAPKGAKDLASARSEIESALRQQKAGSKYAETAENFQNLVYEQADNLQGVAKTLNLPVQQSGWLTRTQAQQIGRNNAKFAQAVFAPDAIQTKRNTEAIEVGPNTLMAARVIDHQAAAPRPFADVKVEIERQLKQKAASEMAVKAGKDKLALLEQGKDAGLHWGKPQILSRQQRVPGFGEDAIQQIFRANAAKLPAYAGSANEAGGFSLYKISKVELPASNDEAKLKVVSAKIGDQLGREAFGAYFAALKQKTEVKIHQENLEKK
jgi:peptidyl-prolyl cis-trans isomerase D